MATIIRAETETQIQHVIALAEELIAWITSVIHEQYAGIDITAFIAEHDYANISAKFPGDHIPPYGCLLLAVADHHEVGGCIALGRLSETICEMRTLYVRPAFRGQGMGKQLVEAILQEAREIGYTHIRLDTLAFMNGALTLYRSVGFRDIEPYRAMPGVIRQHVHFLELDLRA